MRFLWWPDAAFSRFRVFSFHFHAKSRKREIGKSGNRESEIEKSRNREIGKSRKRKREIEKSRKQERENAKAKTRKLEMKLISRLSRFLDFPISRFLDFSITLSRFLDFPDSRFFYFSISRESERRKRENAKWPHPVTIEFRCAHMIIDDKCYPRCEYIHIY